MPNTRISSDLVKRRTISVNDPDWRDLNDLVIKYDLNGVGSLFRLFLRAHQKFGNTLIPILTALVEENDRIQPESKKATIARSNKSMKAIVDGALGE
jgi:hypothetical protein